MFGQENTGSRSPGGAKAVYTLAFTILISAIIVSGSMVFSSSILANAGVGGDGVTGAVAANPAPTPTAPTTPPPTPPPSAVAVSADDDPLKGDPNAPVTIIEFSDFQCPFCGRWYSETLPQVLQNYIDSGQVNLVYRDFPLSFHAEATPAAEAAECAADQDKFWEYHDALFENQGSLGRATYESIATDLGLDLGIFTSCIDNGTHSAEVQADFRDGSAAGVSGTPTFFINGQKIVGAQPYAAFQAAIDAALAAV